MDVKPASFRDTINYRRYLMVGYGEGPGPQHPAPHFKRLFFATNETAERIKYIGLLTYWRSFQYEILNGKV